MPHTTKAIPTGSFQDNFSLRNLAYALLRCGAAATIVVVTAFLVWSLPQALTWLQQYLALYAMSVSVDTAWVIMVLQPALVFSGALLVWTIDEVLQAWQQETVADLAKAQFSVVSPDLFGAKGSVDESYGGTQKNVHFSQKPASYFTPEKPSSATNNSQFPVEEIADQNENSPWPYLFDYKNNHAQDLHSGYDGMTKRVNRRLTPVFDDCAKSSSLVQKIVMVSGQVIMRQGFNQWSGLIKYRHRWLEKWIQSGVLSYSQQSKAYQLWLSSVPVPSSYLTLPARFDGADMLGVKSGEEKLLTQQGCFDADSLESYKQTDSPQCDSLDGATSPEATSSLGSADDTDDAYSGNDKDTSSAHTSWAAGILSLFSPSAKNTSTGYNSDEQVTPPEKPFTTPPTPSVKGTPSSVSFYDGLRRAMRSLDNILGGASSGRSTPVSPDSQKFKREKPSYGTFSLNSPPFDRGIHKQVYSPNPSTSEAMERSPLPRGFLTDDYPLADALLGSPISLSDSPNKDSSPFNDAAFITTTNMSVAKQYPHDDWSPDEGIIRGSRLLGQQGSPDEIDGLAVDLDDLRLQCGGQPTSPIMLGNDSQKPVDSYRETDRVESSLDDIDVVLGGGYYIEDTRGDDTQSTRFDSPSASESEDNSIWVDRENTQGIDGENTQAENTTSSKSNSI